MKAIRAHDFGGSEVLKLDDIADPSPGAGEILIRVHAAGVNPVDWKIRAGFTRGIVDVPVPYVPGAEAAGTVEAVGAGVQAFKVGDPVLAFLGLIGGYAEKVVVPAALAVAKPDNISFAQAAAAPLSVQTAWGTVVDVAQVKAGQRVLIVGAAGGVGLAAVQIALMQGAEVIATCSSRNVDKVKALGAHRVIAYDREDVGAAVSDLDTIIDLAGIDASRPAFAALKPGGAFYTAVSPLDWAAAEQEGFAGGFFGVSPDPERMAKVVSHIANGTIVLGEPQSFPLEAAAEAHDLSQTGHAPARLVLTMAGY